MQEDHVTPTRTFSRARPRSFVIVTTGCLLAIWAGVARGEPGIPPQEQRATPEQEFVTAQLKAVQGDVGAQFTLGGMYTNGYGVWRDYALAAEWFLRAADQGDAKAQMALGYAYSRGQGVAQDDVRALAWYRKAADQGDADAQFILGVMYAEGVGVARDDVEALKWTNLAATRLSADAARVFADRLAKKMTPAEIAEARRREQGWLSAPERRQKSSQK